MWRERDRGGSFFLVSRRCRRCFSRCYRCRRRFRSRRCGSSLRSGALVAAVDCCECGCVASSGGRGRGGLSRDALSLFCHCPKCSSIIPSGLSERVGALLNDLSAVRNKPCDQCCKNNVSHTGFNLSQIFVRDANVPNYCNWVSVLLIAPRHPVEQRCTSILFVPQSKYISIAIRRESASLGHHSCYHT